MSTFVVSIDLENDAFKPDPSVEIRALLLEIAEKVRLYGPDFRTVMDKNGNSVGFTDVWRRAAK